VISISNQAQEGKFKMHELQFTLTQVSLR